MTLGSGDAKSPSGEAGAIASAEPARRVGLPLGIISTGGDNRRSYRLHQSENAGARSCA